MELRHLRHFVALAEEHSFTHAAAREPIVQSGLSSSVRALEAAAAASQAVPEVRGLLAGHLRIDTYPANPRVLPLPPWPAGPTRAHPALEITVRQTDGPAMTRMVTDWRLDCAVVDPVAGPPDGLRALALRHIRPSSLDSRRP